jgi:hypothetical protein
MKIYSGMRLKTKILFKINIQVPNYYKYPFNSTISLAIYVCYKRHEINLSNKRHKVSQRKCKQNKIIID